MTTAVSRPDLHPARRPDEETDEDRIYRGVAFASGDYIPWIVGSLRLGKADLSRMRSSGVPVLRSHNGDAVVGAVTRVEKADGLWRSDWRLPIIRANADTFDQLDRGILRGVSVGGNLDWNSLQIDNESEADWSNPDSILWSADWMLIEESLTSIPADVRAGVDRAAVAALERSPAIFDTVISSAGITTRDTPDVHRRLESLVQTHNESLSVRRQEAIMTSQQTIAPDALERAVADALARSEALQRLTSVPDALDALRTAQEAEEQRNMEYRGKLDRLQFQPGGNVLQMSNWNPNSPALNIGRILRLTADRELGFPQMNGTDTTLEESFLERQELAAPDRNTLARVPYEAIMERTRQREIQRNTMAGGAGARPSQVNIIGDAGLLFSDYVPVLAAMDVKMGLRGSQKVPYFTLQGSAAGAAEGADIPISTYTMNNADLLPVSLASAFDLSSSLQAVDDMTFEALVDFAIMSVCQEELASQVLDGAGSGSNEIAGLWGQVVAAHQHAYGAAQSDFDRADILTTKNFVDLAKTDGGNGQWILSTSLYQLAELTLRGGSASERYLLEDSMMESRMVHHFAGFAPTNITDPGLFVKMNRCCVLIWGDSFQLTEVPVRARKNEYKMVVEANLAVVQPSENLARINQTV